MARSWPMTGVWLVVDGQEQFVAGDVSLIEFALPGAEGTATTLSD